MGLRNRLAKLLRRVRNRYEGAHSTTHRSRIPGALTSARFDITQYTRAEIARKVRYFEKNNPLVQALADEMPTPDVAYWISPLLASGRLA